MKKKGFLFDIDRNLYDYLVKKSKTTPKKLKVNNTWSIVKYLDSNEDYFECAIVPVSTIQDLLGKKVHTFDLIHDAEVVNLDLIRVI